MGIVGKFKKLAKFIKSNNGKVQLTVSLINRGGSCVGKKSLLLVAVAV